MSSAVILSEFKTNQAIDFINNNTFWIGIAQDETEWDNPLVSPEPSVLTTSLTEPISYQRALLSDVFLVMNVSAASAGEIEYEDGYWTQVEEEDAFDENVHHVYIKTVFDSTNHPLVEFRQYGLFLNLAPSAGYEDYYSLLPEQVEDEGIFVAYNNTPKHQRELYKREFIEFILEF
jgi:hypothetical protein